MTKLVYADDTKLTVSHVFKNRKGIPLNQRRDTSIWQRNRKVIGRILSSF